MAMKQAASSPAPWFHSSLRQQEGGDGGEAAEDGGQEDAHVADVHRHVKEVQHVVDEARCHHQAGVHLW